MNYLVLLLAACGLTYAIQAGKAWLVTDLLLPLKFFREMFLCVFCTGCQSGFWIFLVYSMSFNGLTRELLFAIPFGLASGYLAMLLEGLEAKLTAEY